MQFRSLSLVNFRVYYGRQTIDLSNFNKNQKNITLIGGLNGTGKTSILTAIRLLLYGIDKVGKRELAGSINNKHFEEKGKNSVLELEFTFNQKNYKIKGTLHYNSKQELTTMEREMVLDNKKINLTEAELQGFINRNIPSDVSTFFLFDGEKVQELVDQQENGDLKDSIQEIVSLEFYKKVSMDINKAQKKLERKFSRRVSSEKIQDLSKQIEEKEEDLGQYEKDLEAVNKNYRIVRERLESEKQAKNEKFIKSSTSKKTLYENKSKIVREIDNINSMIEAYATDHLPLLILYPKIQQVKDRMEKEMEYSRKKEEIKLNFSQFEEFMNDFIERMNERDELQGIDYKLLNELGRKSWAKVNNLKRYKEPEEIEIIHDLNRSDQSKLQSLNFKELDINKQQKRKDQLLQDLKKVDQQLIIAPEEVDVSKEEKEIERLNKTLSQYNSESLHYREKVNGIHTELTRLRRKLEEMRKELDTNTDLDKQLDMINKAAKVSAQFVEDVTEFKAKCIKESFEYIIDKLMSKSDDFSKAEFDVDSYKLRLFNHYGNQIRLANRSAGEKQIIALSLIWALTKNAAIDLPYVIDTPLGRLDSIHRRHLIKHYFSELSNQVIILSTDTEVNDELLSELETNIGSTFSLDYSSDTKSTTINEGYFV
ncbi:DNA sulfur modification protein DndD [Salimicrobium flavidum]|uniref:Nuclease SbcCD subunit C n=1 Tax=Salimicrobium flavidum TaxID=570947 RepID=A0A1N7KNY4_9BACI|nr:DNA sulfur modification protein DndD [Salimicrobium flavidum]SIS63319.1 DNA sulfur modification protein DndD [Salimicrobium flavidum]